MTLTPERLRKLHSLPVVGPWLLSRAVGSVAPYFASIAPRIAVLERGRCDVGFRNRRRVRSHLGTVHAIAMCNACELAAGLAIDASLPATLRWIPRGMVVRYIKKAETDLVARARVEEVSEGEVVVPVRVSDASEQVVMEADITMYVSARRLSEAAQVRQ
jgi:acyl-coenzyme A thioesterase PaaI-like protein